MKTGRWQYSPKEIAECTQWLVAKKKENPTTRGHEFMLLGTYEGKRTHGRWDHDIESGITAYNATKYTKLEHMAPSEINLVECIFYFDTHWEGKGGGVYRSSWKLT